MTHRLDEKALAAAVNEFNATIDQPTLYNGATRRIIAAYLASLPSPESAEAEVARLTEALKTVRLSLQTELERGVITDTLWMNDSPSETIFDALDASLTKGQSNAQ